MSRSPLRYRLLLSAASFLLTVAMLEAGLRIWLPSLTTASFGLSARQFEIDPHTGYRIKPNAVIGDEVMNRDGFRGPDRQIPKPGATYRILAVGDSVVQAIAGDVRYEQTWEQRLDTSLNADATTGSPARSRRYEVINAGVPGFSSWQTLAHLRDRGLRYQPDLVVVLVGWNDMADGWLPGWHPGMGGDQITETVADRWWSLWSEAVRRARQVSYSLRLFHRMRVSRHPRLVPAPRSRERRMAFNQPALDFYVSTLEKIHDLLTSERAVMAAVAFPDVAGEDLTDMIDVPTLPTIADVEDAYDRYMTAIRELAARHPDVILIDAAREFAKIPEQERVRYFSDSIHLSVEGNDLMARVVAQALQDRGIPR
jgi:lysophospholipase L1-like esterase